MAEESEELTGLCGELGLVLGLEPFVDLAVLILVAAFGNGLGEVLQAHVPLAVAVLGIYIWASHSPPFMQ